MLKRADLRLSPRKLCLRPRRHLTGPAGPSGLSLRSSACLLALLLLVDDGVDAHGRSDRAKERGRAWPFKRYG
jgi:hypothetical protein